ncbi:hypothetical protein QZH41_007572 [Actinostola sp. cb2023]|nr:hypothetical protein QZH41_007572 [Actinostola sp. cb2023]
MAGVATFKTIIEYIPGLTQYRYTIANLHRLQYGPAVPVPTQQVRMRVDEKQLDHFLSYITSPHLVQDLPFGEKILKLSSGHEITVPNVIRTLIPQRVVRQHQQYCAESGFTPFSERTMTRVLSECRASVRKSLQGLDYVAADGARGFDDLALVLEGTLSPKRQQLQEALKEGKLYLKGDYKVQCSLDYNCDPSDLDLVTSAEEMRDALLSHGGIEGVRVAALLRLDETFTAFLQPQKIPGISKLHNFWFEDEDLHATRAYKIGHRKKFVLSQRTDLAKVKYASFLQEGTGRILPSIRPQTQVVTSEEGPHLQKGWALKETKKAYRFNKTQTDYLEAKFQIGEVTGNKVEASIVSKEMRRKRGRDGEKLFRVSEFLTTQQITAYFSRLAAKARRQTPEEDDLLAADEELHYQEARHGILSKFQLQHPVSYEEHDLCIMGEKGTIKSLALPTLQSACAQFELNVPEKPVRKKAPYVALLQEMQQSCSCRHVAT